MASIESYNILHRSMFSAAFNANDFFQYACAQAVNITEEDFPWVLEHIEKYGQEGMDACMSYIQNQEPVTPRLTKELKVAIQELMDRNQEVYGDIDWQFHYYNDKGPYRQINKD